MSDKKQNYQKINKPTFRFVTPYNYCSKSGEYIDPEPCEKYDDCADIMTPKQAMLKMLAGGQIADLHRRSVYYDEQELQDYQDAEYPCDYVAMYNDYMASISGVSQESNNSQDANSPKGKEKTSADEKVKEQNEKATAPVNPQDSTIQG